MYRLDKSFADGHFTVTVVGCGGTGGFVAEGLCRLLPPRADLVLIDHDRVEERNLTCQNFTREDLGQFKSEALARRLTRRFGRPIAYTTLPLGMAQVRYPGLIIGCVDNGPARRQIAERVAERALTWVGGYSEAVPREWQSGPRLETSLWWVDAGNGENYGQVIIGNAKDTRLVQSFDQERRVCLALPLPIVQRLELLSQVPERRDCAGAVLAGEQGPVINQAMASLVLEVVRKLIDGTCRWMQVYIDLDSGTLSSVLATPDAVERITGIKRRKLVKG